MRLFGGHLGRIPHGVAKRRLEVQGRFRTDSFHFRNPIQRRRTWRRPRGNVSRDEKLKILEISKTTKKSKKKIIRNKNVPKQQSLTAPKLVSAPKVPLSPIDAAKRRMKKTLLVARLDGLNHLLTPKVPKQPKNCPIFQKRRQKLKLLS